MNVPGPRSKARPYSSTRGGTTQQSSGTVRGSTSGSDTYHANVYRRLMGVPAADWRDPLALARPATGAKNPGFKATGVAYSNAKPAVIYYAHELQRQIAPGVDVVVFEPGWMPGTGLGRGMPAAAQAIGRGLGRLPGGATRNALAPRWLPSRSTRSGRTCATGRSRCETR